MSITAVDFIKIVTGEEVFKIEDADDIEITYWLAKYSDDGSAEYDIKTITVDKFIDMCKEWAFKKGFELVTGFSSEKKHFCEAVDAEKLRIAIDFGDSEGYVVLMVCKIILHRINMRKEAVR